MTSFICSYYKILKENHIQKRFDRFLTFEILICSIFGSYFENLGDISQHVEKFVNEIAKIINGTYTASRGIFQGFQIYFAGNPGLKGMEGLC